MASDRAGFRMRTPSYAVLLIGFHSNVLLSVTPVYKYVFSLTSILRISTLSVPPHVPSSA